MDPPPIVQLIREPEETEVEVRARYAETAHLLLYASLVHEASGETAGGPADHLAAAQAPSSTSLTSDPAGSSSGHTAGGFSSALLSDESVIGAASPGGAFGSLGPPAPASTSSGGGGGSAGGGNPMPHLPQSHQVLSGGLISNCHILNDINGTTGVFFVFSDLSVRIGGKFRLKFMLFNLKS
ncbi:hypothetical protein HK101_004902, partial [Irineochytrium annulatum]